MKRPASTRSAITTTGMTTAIAVFPAAERPALLFDDLLPPGSRLEPDDVAAAEPEEVVEPIWSLAVVTGVGVVILVTTTVEGCNGVPFDVAVTTEVTSCVVGAADGATTDEVWTGGGAVVVRAVVPFVVSAVVVSAVVVSWVVVSLVVGSAVTVAMISTIRRGRAGGSV
jgi:hypothetical protein